MTDLETLYQTAMAEHRAGRLDAAETLYRQVLDRDRLFARAWHLLGVARYQRGDVASAIEYVERAIGLEPQWPVFYGNLATIYVGLGQAARAEAALRRALELDPQYAAATSLLAHVLTQQNRCDEALDVYGRARELSPRDANVLKGHAFALSELGYVEESIATYLQASELSSNPIYRILAAIQLPLVYSSGEDVLRWRNRLVRELDALVAEGITADVGIQTAESAFSLPHQGFDDLDIQRKLARLYRPPALASGIWQPRPDGGIRVGFISSFFNSHTIGKLTRGLITGISRSDFHVTVFSVGRHDDPIAREIATSADRFVMVPHDLPQARQVILSNSVDVLVYLDIGMSQLTYTLALSRLAPVQCTTWGHPETTGLETIDYFVSSAEMETAEADAHYSERLVRLPSLTFYFHRSQLPAEVAGREAFGLHATARLYACPQSIYKFHPDFDAALAGILRRDREGQVVLIKWAYPQVDEMLRRRFAATMPDVADRIVFINRLQQPQFMNFLTLIDVMLDPFPYGGGNSSLEAFSFGVPVVTLPTGFLRGRITQAFCRRLGVEQCIARDVEDYVDIAVRLGTNGEFRQKITGQIMAGQGRLFEDASAIRDWERFFHSARANGI
jgi:predicted O-linked N-acetylglucosamine transferase (SPINDLY family)